MKSTPESRGILTILVVFIVLFAVSFAVAACAMGPSEAERLAALRAQEAAANAQAAQAHAAQAQAMAQAEEAQAEQLQAKAVIEEAKQEKFVVQAMNQPTMLAYTVVGGIIALVILVVLVMVRQAGEDRRERRDAELLQTALLLAAQANGGYLPANEARPMGHLPGHRAGPGPNGNAARPRGFLGNGRNGRQGRVRLIPDDI